MSEKERQDDAEAIRSVWRRGEEEEVMLNFDYFSEK